MIVAGVPFWSDPLFWIVALAILLLGYVLGLHDSSPTPPPE